MWFNSRRSEKPYQGLTCYRTFLWKQREIRKDGSTGVAWLSSARAVRCSLKWGNERNPREMLHIHFGLPRLYRGGRRGRRQVSTSLMPWVTHTLQWRTTKSSKSATTSKSHKFRLSSDCSLQPDCMKEESVVIANQQVAVNTFSGLVHTARQGSKVGSG